MNKDVNIYSFNDECYVYLGDYRKLQQENEKLIYTDEGNAFVKLEDNYAYQQND